ncbi:MAG: hypothetical protein R3F59_13160 [Myxococcota bacterium]
MLTFLALSLSVAHAEAPPPPATVGAPNTAPAAVRLSALPNVGWHAAPDEGLGSFGFGLVSRQTTADGVDLQMIASWVDGRMRGSQISPVVNVAGDVQGLQIAMGANWSRDDVRFSQLSMGANVAEEDVFGFQGTMGANVARGARRRAGVDGREHRARDGLGRGAGVERHQHRAAARRGAGRALGLADDIAGVQLGLVNLGRNVDGLQLGLVNVAKTSKVSIAPINLIEDGLHHVDVWVSESAVGAAALKFGSRNMYTLLGVGWVNPKQRWWTFGGGWGVHLQRDDLWIEADDSVWGLANANVLAPGVQNRLRLQGGWALREHLQPFVGASLNTWVGTGAVWPRPTDEAASGHGQRAERGVLARRARRPVDLDGACSLGRDARRPPAAECPLRRSVAAATRPGRLCSHAEQCVLAGRDARRPPANRRASIASVAAATRPSRLRSHEWCVLARPGRQATAGDPRCPLDR